MVVTSEALENYERILVEIVWCSKGAHFGE